MLARDALAAVSRYPRLEPQEEHDKNNRYQPEMPSIQIKPNF
jgi:hypothetical protein